MKRTILIALAAIALLAGAILLLARKADAPATGGATTSAPAPTTGGRFIVCPGHPRCPKGVRGRIPDPALQGD